MEDLLFHASTQTGNKQLRISELLFTEYKCLAESAAFDIWSQHNYFVYVLTGKLKWKTPGGEYLTHQGDTLFVKKGGSIINKYFDEGFCCLLIFMPDDYIRNVARLQTTDILKIRETETDSVIRLPLDGSLHTYFQSMCSYFFREEAPSAALLEVKFRELILNILSSSQQNEISSYFKSLLQTSKTSVQAVMEANYTYNLSLEEFARLCCRSLTVFKKDSKDIYHISPGKWLTLKRLEYARNLLLNTDKTINELILECGFENASHFTRVFKENFGTTPQKYRQSVPVLSPSAF